MTRKYWLLAGACIAILATITFNRANKYLEKNHTTSSTTNTKFESPAQDFTAPLIPVDNLLAHKEDYIGKKVRVIGTIYTEITDSRGYWQCNEEDCSFAKVRLRGEKYTSAVKSIALMNGPEWFASEEAYPCLQIKPNILKFKCGPYTSGKEERAIITGIWRKYTPDFRYGMLLADEDGTAAAKYFLDVE